MSTGPTADSELSNVAEACPSSITVDMHEDPKAGAAQLLKEKEQLEQELDLLTNEIQNQRDELGQEREKQDALKTSIYASTQRIENLREAIKNLVEKGKSRSDYEELLAKEKESKKMLQELEKQVDECREELEDLESSGGAQEKNDMIEKLEEQLRQVTEELEALEKAKQQPSN